MNTIQLLREAGPEGPALSTDSRNAARAALMAEIDAAARPRRVRLPSRKVRRRVAIGGVAVAASWAAAVVVAAPDGPGTPADSVRLVEFHMPTFPLSLDPEPPGLRPGFTGDASGADFAEYDDAEGDTAFTMGVGEDEPDLEELDAGLSVGPEEDARVDGREATLVRGSHDVPCEDGLSICGTRDFTQLVWEFQDDVWVFLEGRGSYADPQRLIGVAESVVDRPQPATLAVGLAPDGWSIDFYKMGRVVSLVNDEFEQQSLSVHVPLPEEVIPADQVRRSIMGPIGPQLDVTVNGRPAQLVRVDVGYVVDGHRYEGWYLQAQFEDGTTFVVQAPEAFTQEQVVQMAEQVTYNP
jgi:hypothetical protein